MNRVVYNLLTFYSITVSTLAVAASAATAGTPDASPPNMEVMKTDKLRTNAAQQKEPLPQVLAEKQLANYGSSSAEGMGFEPTTPCGAPDFESKS